MPTQTKAYRFHLPKKAIKSDCPDCSPKYRKTLSRYIDAQNGELLPEQYGRCDRESKCGYHLGPYQKGPSGLSYHDEMKALSGIGPISKSWFSIVGKQKRKGLSKQAILLDLMQTQGATLEQVERTSNKLYFF